MMVISLAILVAALSISFSTSTNHKTNIAATINSAPQRLNATGATANNISSDNMSYSIIPNGSTWNYGLADYKLVTYFPSGKITTQYIFSNGTKSPTDVYSSGTQPVVIITLTSAFGNKLELYVNGVLSASGSNFSYTMPIIVGKTYNVGYLDSTLNQKSKFINITYE
jgi:hypothetical protein